jgi:PAS domain S-box-containing protein
VSSDEKKEMYRVKLIRNKLISLAATMFASVLIASAIGASIIYETSLSETKDRLTETVQSNARLIEAVARHDVERSLLHMERHESTLGYIKTANEMFQFGHTGEFTLAKKEDDKVVFLLRNRLAGNKAPEPVPFADSSRAEPMRRALSGESGSMVGYDYRGILVVAAYEPIEILNYGIVAKLDMQEINEPYYQAGMVTLIIAILVSLIAMLIFYRLSAQISERFADSSKQFIRLASNAKDVIYRMSLPDGRYEYVNPAATEIFGFSPQDFYNSPIFIRDIIHPDSRSYFDDQWEKLLVGDVPPTYEYQVIAKSGESKWINQRNVLITNEKGDPVAIEGIVSDVTERKQAAELLRKSEKKYSTLIENANDGVVIVQDMQFKFCNRAMADITGYSLDELQGMNFLTPIDAEFRELVSERYKQRLAGENPPDQYALRFVCKDGAFKEIEASSIRRSRYEDRPAITATYRDITEKKRAQEKVSRLLNGNRRLSRQLMQSQEDERRYIARELHDELGQSLTAIDIASRLISQYSKEERVIDKAAMIGQITSKLFKDVRSMLVTIRPPMLDPLGLLAALESLIEQWKASTDIACTLNISGSTDDFPDIVNIAIYRVLQECLTNIKRHSEADQVEVTLSRVAQESESGQSEEVLQLDVRDNGKGMNLEGPYSMGLGMVGMRERIDALHGSLVINSSPGQGMHVSVMIPIAMEDCI